MSEMETLYATLRDIREQLQKHERLLNRLEVEIVGGLAAGCPSADSRQSALVRKALFEAIEVLDDSRKAFKSPRLEALRKKLVRVLAEIDRDCGRSSAVCLRKESGDESKE